ncbi:MAG TPA: glycosyltransferase family 4 protein [Planctomycetota bacterium]|jgi:glycosyltransferase involved in cell wall biosynthesis
MRILILHNRYRQPGGEDVAVAAQTRLLRSRGHDVELIEKDNREIDGYSFPQKVALFFKTASSADSAREVAKVVNEFRPQVAHVHNTLPLLSPSIYEPLQDVGVKVIQHLHNYRLVCPAGTLFRDGEPCTLCLNDLKHATAYRCWTGSLPASIAVVRMLERHRELRTWHTKVDLFVALNNYMRDILVQAHVIPAEKVVVQPNFIACDQPAEAQPESCFVFIGRLTAEKGVATLLQSARRIASPVQIIGGGPAFAELRAAASPTVEFLGQLPRDAALNRLASARALIFPSLWPEGCPTTILEAQALGKAVIASRIPGAMELIQDNVNGLLFDPGDADGLTTCMRKLQDDAALAARLGQAGHERYLREYSPEAGYRRMLENYTSLGVEIS